MNKDQLASVVASEVGLSQSDAKAAVDAVFDGITNGMKNGDKVSIAGAFKAAKGLKDSLN